MLRFNKVTIFPESDVCSVCLDTLDNSTPIIKTKCNHTFHNKCLRRSIHNSIKCPCCRSDLISNQTISRLIHTQNIISISFTDENIMDETCFDSISKSIDEMKNNVCDYVSKKINKIAEQNVLFVFIMLPIGYTLIAIYFASNLIVNFVIKPALFISKCVYKVSKYLYKNLFCL